MGYDEILQSKAIGKYLKSKGYGKQHLYCQMCRKQTRDDNGFKCHLTSPKHIQNMRLFEENPEYYIEKFSGEFERGMVSIIKNSFSNQWVEINSVYNDYIKMRNQTRLNGTKWVELSDFVIYLGKTGQAKVDDRGAKGWWIYFMDKDAKEEVKEKKERAQLDEETRNRLELEKRVKLAQELEPKIESERPTELKLEKKNEIKLTLNSKSANPQKKLFSFEKRDEELKEREEKKRKRQEDQTGEKKKQKNSRHKNWIMKGIVVKIINKDFADGQYYKQKGVITKVEDDVAILRLESKVKMKIHQRDLETVIPREGGKVKIVNGNYRGATGTLLGIQMDKYRAEVEIDSEPHKGIRSWEEYEDISRGYQKFPRTFFFEAENKSDSFMDFPELNLVKEELKRFFSANYKNTNLKSDDLKVESEAQKTALKEWVLHFKQEDKENIYQYLETHAATLDSFGPYAYALRNLIFSKSIEPKEDGEKKAKEDPKPLHQVDGLREGVEILYYTGTKQKQSQRLWSKGLLQGEEKNWYKNGLVMHKRFWKDSRLNGEEKRWHPNGQLSFQFSWKDHKIVGEDRSWYENGKPSYERTLTDDMKFTGPEKRWYDNGQLELMKSWNNGKETGEERRFDRDGKEVYHCRWVDGVKFDERKPQVKEK